MYNVDKYSLNLLTTVYTKEVIQAATVAQLNELLVLELRSLHVLSMIDHPLFPDTCTLIVGIHRVNGNQISIILPKAFVKLLSDAKEIYNQLTLLQLLRS